jgi:hypothetical protein
VSSGGDGKFAHFIFANLDGTISAVGSINALPFREGTFAAWDTGPTAFVQTMGAAGTVYTGLAINGAQTRLYAANDAAPGRIDVYDCSFKPVNLGPEHSRTRRCPPGLRRSTCSTLAATFT